MICYLILQTLLKKIPQHRSSKVGVEPQTDSLAANVLAEKPGQSVGDTKGSIDKYKVKIRAILFSFLIPVSFNVFVMITFANRQCIMLCTL